MNEKGFVNLIYIGVIAILAVLILVGSYSRFLSAVKSRSYLIDRLPEEYRAESEIGNYLAQYYQGNLDAGSLDLPKRKNLDGASLDIRSNNDAQNNSIEVVLSKGLVNSKYNLFYPIFLSDPEATKVIIALDCTNSQLKDYDFQLHADGVNLLVVAYGERAVWLTPNNDNYNCLGVTDQIGETSSPGTGMIFANNQLQNFNGNKIAILVVADEPESVKQTLGSTCLENEDCALCKEKALDYLSCTMADINTKWNRYEKGNRNPSVQLYTVYMNENLPSSQLNESLRKFSNQSMFINTPLELARTLQQIVENVGNTSYRATIEKVVE